MDPQLVVAFFYEQTNPVNKYSIEEFTHDFFYLESKDIYCDAYTGLDFSLKICCRDSYMQYTVMNR